MPSEGVVLHRVRGEDGQGVFVCVCACGRGSCLILHLITFFPVQVPILVIVYLAMQFPDGLVTQGISRADVIPRGTG